MARTRSILRRKTLREFYIYHTHPFYFETEDGVGDLFMARTRSILRRKTFLAIDSWRAPVLFWDGRRYGRSNYGTYPFYFETEDGVGNLFMARTRLILIRRRYGRSNYGTYPFYIETEDGVGDLFMARTRFILIRRRCGRETIDRCDRWRR